MSTSCYAHFVHVNGELGDVDDEVILGPFPSGVQLTYCWLRENENIATVKGDGLWYTTRRPYGTHVVERGPFTDVSFPTERPESVLMAGPPDSGPVRTYLVHLNIQLSDNSLPQAEVVLIEEI